MRRFVPRALLGADSAGFSSGSSSQPFPAPLGQNKANVRCRVCDQPPHQKHLNISLHPEEAQVGLPHCWCILPTPQRK